MGFSKCHDLLRLEAVTQVGFPKPVGIKHSKNKGEMTRIAVYIKVLKRRNGFLGQSHELTAEPWGTVI